MEAFEQLLPNGQPYSVAFEHIHDPMEDLGRAEEIRLDGFDAICSERQLTVNRAQTDLWKSLRARRAKTGLIDSAIARYRRFSMGSSLSKGKGAFFVIGPDIGAD